MMRRLLLLVLLIGTCFPALGAPAEGDPPDPGAVDIGSRRELFLDDHVLESLEGAERRLHHPVAREVVLRADEPWEGNVCAYFTVFPDGKIFRMYYRGLQIDPSSGKRAHEEVVCYAESDDGIHWRKPRLGLVEFDGSKENNIVWDGLGSHDFTPFRDTRPDCPPDARYKAFGRGRPLAAKGLWAFRSADGIHWSLLAEEPVITKGAFDSQNLAFWDAVRGEYRAYFRDFRDGKRDIRTSISRDFVHWSDPVWLEYPGAGREHLYTNQIRPYHRAPHIFVGFPTRYVDRKSIESFRTLPHYEERRARARTRRRWGTAITETLIMSSRDGRTFERSAGAFIRPGPRRTNNWAYGDNYVAWHLLQTSPEEPGMPEELSLYATEGYWIDSETLLRRYTLRLDGFVSLHAPLRGGEARTKPLRFAGNRLLINYSTSAAGTVRVEITDGEGNPHDGFSAADCDAIFGDEIERVVEWNGDPDVSGLAGKTVRLRFLIEDGDLYSFRFGPAG